MRKKKWNKDKIKKKKKKTKNGKSQQNENVFILFNVCICFMDSFMIRRLVMHLFLYFLHAAQTSFCIIFFALIFV